ncbi:MAG TPA: 4-hydroxy-tetrahydrodipicolinate reductase [Armatimonadota bacterium]|jgi:4-hydroxy-tetrahydrodipicolinate reductase
MPINVLVTGAAGKMGRAVVKAVTEADGMRVVAAVDPGYADSNPPTDAGTLAGVGEIGVSIDSNLVAALRRAGPDVTVDFTRPNVVMGNLRKVLAEGAAAVVGTTGLSEADLAELERLCDDNDTSCFVAPNFAIGAVLMMQFAQTAARFMPDVEIIEMHHNQKLDAPSGTALRTAELAAAARIGASTDRTEKETLQGARGGDLEGIKIHSVRLPGFVASQAVIFGGQGQTLTIRHDTLDRSSFMPGVVLAIRNVQSLPGLTVGLEKLML